MAKQFVNPRRLMLLGLLLCLAFIAFAGTGVEKAEAQTLPALGNLRVTSLAWNAVTIAWDAYPRTIDYLVTGDGIIPGGTGTRTSRTLTSGFGLVPGQTYTVTVTARGANAAGTDFENFARGSVTFTVPNRPAAFSISNIQIENTKGSEVTISWTAARSIAEYSTSVHSTGGSTPSYSESSARSGRTSATFTRLSPGHPYQYEIYGYINDVPTLLNGRNDRFTTPSFTSTAPSPATSLRATASTTESAVVLTWSAGSNADSYRVEWSTTSSDFSDTSNRRTVIGTMTTIGPLLPGHATISE